jgi:hypothetical protein
MGCRRDKAGNRKLHFDEYCLLVLLSLFNPTVTSLRSLQQASQLKGVQKKLGCSRVSLGSFSEATDVFDPTRLEAIIEQLLGQIPQNRQVGGETGAFYLLPRCSGSGPLCRAPLPEIHLPPVRPRP